MLPGLSVIPDVPYNTAPSNNNQTNYTAKQHDLRTTEIINNNRLNVFGGSDGSVHSLIQNNNNNKTSKNDLHDLNNNYNNSSNNNSNQNINNKNNKKNNNLAPMNTISTTTTTTRNSSHINVNSQFKSNNIRLTSTCSSGSPTYSRSTSSSESDSSSSSSDDHHSAISDNVYDELISSSDFDLELTRNNNDNNKNISQDMLVRFKCMLSDEKEVEWSTLLVNGVLYVDIPNSVLPKGSRDSFVSLLEFAEEKLECDKVYVCFKRNRPDRMSLMRVFMFFGFTVVPPGDSQVPQNDDIISMIYNIQ